MEGEAAQVPAVIADATPDVPPPMDFTVIARDPHEMAEAQKQMIQWASAKHASEATLLSEAEANYAIAVAQKWKSSPWQSQIAKARKRTSFYERVLRALEAGYYIVPPFPLEIFAIRTTRLKPDAKTSQSRWESRAQSAQSLPVGEGRYLSPDPVTYYRTLPSTDAAGKPTSVKEYFAHHFEDVEFPFALAKPAILKATAEAMALKIFDRMGCLPNTNKVDPVICGQIISPKQYGEPVTFFIAWWLDTRTL